MSFELSLPFFYFRVSVLFRSKESGFSVGIKNPKYKQGWRSFGWDKSRGWWKWHQARPV